MNYLLDTHILLWAVQKHPKLSQKAIDIIKNPEHTLYFSSASIWEVAIKMGRGAKPDEDLINPTLPYQTLLKKSYRPLTINSLHASEVLLLPSIHKDPFDRMLIAQARIENLILMTVDEHIVKYDVNFLEV